MARKATYAGPIEGCVERLQRWIDAGALPISVRVAGGDQLAQVDEATSRFLPWLKRGGTIERSVKECAMAVTEP